MGVKTPLPVLGILLLNLNFCSLDYQEARLAGTMPEETPATILQQVKHTVVRQGKVMFILEAERAEEYNSKKTTRLRGVHFQEFDEYGALLTEGWAEEALFNTETEDAELTGSILLYSYPDEENLSAEYLSWIREGKILTAGSDDMVRLGRGDGSFVEGKGFRADFRRKRLAFSSGVQGRYVVEEED